MITLFWVALTFSRTLVIRYCVALEPELELFLRFGLFRMLFGRLAVGWIVVAGTLASFTV